MKKNKYDHVSLAVGIASLKRDPEMITKMRKKVFKVLRKKNTNFQYISTGGILIIGVRHDNGEIVIWEIVGGITMEHTYTPKKK